MMTTRLSQLTMAAMAKTAPSGSVGRMRGWRQDLLAHRAGAPLTRVSSRLSFPR